MRAYWLDEARPDAGVAITPEELAANGVTYVAMPLEAYEQPLDVFMRENGYVTRDEIQLSPATPNLAAIEAKFDREHLHTDDEVRYVLEGEGIFDIRSEDDRWMRVVVTAGDLISVPKDRHHRFMLTELKQIRCARLFVDVSGWTPHYR
jgi:1,2-dihydroxy-3-keto-5-methylthiopentene dioxygenase